VQPETIYDIWIPPDGAWSLWARPVLFAQMSAAAAEATGAGRPAPAVDVSWAPPPQENVLLVIDLPGDESVYAGLGLAARGYRPVPTYNACADVRDVVREVVPQGPIQQALRQGAPYLRSLNLPADAPPAFLLDANRMAPGADVRPGLFDNRWQVFPQDFPSARFLLGRGITRVIVVQRGSRVPRDDLAHVLRRWQDAGIEVWAKDLLDAAAPVPIRVSRPAWYRVMWYRALAVLRLTRNPLGGFGEVVPEPPSSQG
jgi:hypothetical protein